MKFTIYKNDIINQLSNLSRVTSKIQPNINIIADNDNIILNSTNGSIILQYKLKANDISGESVSVNAKEIYSLFDRLQGKIEFNNGAIKCGKIKLKIGVEKNIKLEPTSLPFNEGKIINLNNFKEVIKKRLFACSKSEYQEIIKNICINGKEACSTDSNILSLGTFEQEIGEFLIPQEVANEITKCFEGEEIEIAEEGNKVLYKNDNVELISFKVNGAFPKYEQLLPKFTSGGAKINSKDLLKNLEILSLIATENKRVKLTLENNKLLLSVISSNNSGDIEQEIEYTDDKFEVYFNIDYLISMLKNIGSENIIFRFDNPSSACTFETATDYTLIMPMLVK